MSTTSGSAAVQRGIDKRLLRRHQDVDLVSFVGAVLAEELHYLPTRSGNRCEIAREHESMRKLPVRA